jgi:folate-binding protein YgfZ
MRLALGFFLIAPISIHSFVVQPSRQAHLSSTVVYQSEEGNSFDTPNPNPSSRDLPSAYPPGTPSVLRGEAVRSALKSGRCIGWSFDDKNDDSPTPLSMGGMVQVQGKGTVDFLNNKLTQSFHDNNNNRYKEACLLDPKGRVVDRLRVSILDPSTALLMTSPGHSSQRLLERLDPFIFPMDQVELQNINDSFAFTLASTQLEHVHKVMRQQAFPDIPKQVLEFPTGMDQCSIWEVENGSTKILVIPSTGLPSVACVGYTFVFYGSETAKSLGFQKWQYLIGDANPEGPIGIGQLEYETLRIEAGQPAYGYEIGGGNSKDSIKTSPLELHWQEETIDMEKGCYLGQEGVASIAKNPRGPPRTLYAVVFDDDFNMYETESRESDSDMENLTAPPRPGQTLYALGSNEQLSVGTVTSVAEAGGTGERSTAALALVRRSDSILKKMKAYNLEIPRDAKDFIDVAGDSSGMIQPPPLDPLDGMEVIIGGTFTVGILKMIPSRRLRRGRSMFDEEIVVDMPEISITTTPQPVPDEEDVEKLQKEAEQAAEEAKDAEAEAQRKADKMELLKKRAEEAIERIKKKKEDNN